MRRHQDAGGPNPASATHMFGLSPVHPAPESPVATAETELAAMLGASRAPAPARAMAPIGKLLTCRPRPRRLDARIVKRRPLMLIRRRAWGPASLKRVAGREIVARS